VWKTVGEKTTWFVYDAQGQLAAEYGEAAASPCTTCFVTVDWLGSTRLVTDGAKAVQRGIDYLPFGEEIRNGHNGRTAGVYELGANGSASYPGAADAVTGRFTGKERDAETGLDYFLARYYSPAQGRFTSPDEWAGGIVDPFTGQQVGQPGPLPYADISDPQTLNKYVYVRNSPLRYTDPDGHSKLEFDGEKKTITLYDKDGKELGSWSAGNNVDSKATLAGGLPNGTYEFLDTTSPHRHSKDKDAVDVEYGTQGIFRIKNFSGPDKDKAGNLREHAGVGVHAGRENKADGVNRKGTEHATQGCVRTTEEGMKKIANTSKSDALTTLTVKNRRELKKDQEVRK
jgi:RHS repeat-associated protein